MLIDPSSLGIQSTPTSISITATDANKLANTLLPSAASPPGSISTSPTSTPFTFTVTRSGDTSGAENVTYAVTASGSNPAQASDFVGGAFPTGTLSFAAGQSSQTLTVALGDHLTPAAPNVGFTVTVTAPDGSAASAAGNIQGVAAPSVAQLADFANAASDPLTTKVDGYVQVDHFGPTGPLNLAQPGGFDGAGFYAVNRAGFPGGRLVWVRRPRLAPQLRHSSALPLPREARFRSVRAVGEC